MIWSGCVRQVRGVPSARVIRGVPRAARMRSVLPAHGTRPAAGARGTTWSAAAPGDGAAHGPPLIVGTPTRAVTVPSELHPAGRRRALKPPHPRPDPLLHSLERTSKKVRDDGGTILRYASYLAVQVIGIISLEYMQAPAPTCPSLMGVFPF
jgi:hypothetical protein